MAGDESIPTALAAKLMTSNEINRNDSSEKGGSSEEAARNLNKFPAVDANGDAEKADVSSVNGTKAVISSSDEQRAVEAHYVHGPARIALVFGLCVTTFLVGLDQMIIATAIPKITTLFHSLEDVGWYGVSTHLMLCCVMCTD
jgi:hypothetical protein